jgi:hypothetical protein
MASQRTLTTPLITLLRVPFGSALVAAYTRFVRGLGLRGGPWFRPKWRSSR